MCMENTYRNAVAETIDRVRARRKALGLSAERLAQICTKQGYPLSRSTLANLESGRRDDIGLAELTAFARALKTTIAELVSEPLCANCKGSPPEGFRCLHCGRGELGGEGD